MKQSARFAILIAIMIVYAVGFFMMIAPIPEMPAIIKAITLVGPEFVLLGLIRKQQQQKRRP